MARSPQIEKDKIRRKTFLRTEKVYRSLKAQAMNLHLSDDIRLKAKSKLALIDPKGFPVRIKNRCITTGKARSVLRKFAMSHTSVRMLARAGSISGMKKASWLYYTFLLLW